MMRRIAIATLIVALCAAAVPSSAFAEDTNQAAPPTTTRVSAMLQQPSHTLSLQNATKGVTLVRSVHQETGGFLSRPRGKATLAVAIIVAAIVVGYAASQGPDPTPATER